MSVDVIVPTHERWELTERCLDHLRQQTIDHRVIVVDGGSTDGTPDKVRQRFPECTVVDLPENRGYAVACNRGVAAGNGEIVVLLNNDAFCRPDALEHVVRAFAANDRAGSVAPVATDAQEQSILSVGNTIDVTLAGFPRLRGHPLADVAVAQPLLAGPTAVEPYRRTAWEEVGGTDERLFLYMVEDELALRLAAAGWGTAIVPEAVAIHLVSSTHGWRTPWSRRQYGFGRGYVLRRYGVLRSRVAIRAVATEAFVVLGDLVLSRDLAALRGRIEGWRAAKGLERLPLPIHLLDRRIGFIESLRLRWSAR